MLNSSAVVYLPHLMAGAALGPLPSWDMVLSMKEWMTLSLGSFVVKQLHSQLAVKLL